MQMTHVKEIMEAHPVMIKPDATLQDAARKMKEVDCGFLPVGSDSSPEGVITDRDIVVRAISEGKDPAREVVRDYMTTEVCACSESDTIEDAADMMNQNDVSRLVVKDKSGKICGVLSFGHVIRTNEDREEISEVVDRATGMNA